jgi:two-component system chemotaxis response regulator CheY
MNNDIFQPSSLVVVVDDMPIMRTLVREALIDYGFKNIIEFGNGREAWNFLEKTKVDLVISDFNMPHLNGIELLRNIRKSELNLNLYFLMITTQNEEDIILEALELKADNFIVKPFTPEKLKKKLSKKP